MDSRAPVLRRAAGRVFWLGGEPDPRALQLGFFVLLHLALLGAQSFEMTVVDPVVWALRLSALSLVATFLITPRLPDHDIFIRVLANVDLAIIGLTALRQDVGTLPLVVVPAMWLGRQLLWRAVWRVALSTTVLVSLPGTLAHGNADQTAVQLAVLPGVAVVAAIAIAVGLDSARAAQAEAERQRSEAQQALAALAEERLATAAIVETVDVGLVLLDREGRVRLRNKRQEEIDQHKHPGGRGRSLPQHVYDQDACTPLAMLALPSTVATRGEQFNDFRIWVGEHQSERRALSVSARQVHDEHGERVGAVLAYKDITDLMRALRVKDEFIALVSHELRTPLTSIYGYVSLLSEREDLPAAATGQLEVIMRNTYRLQVLVDDLLEAAQVAAGSFRLRRRPVDLAQMAREAAASQALLAEAAGVHLSVDAPASVSITLDEERMAQVLDNLISNAVKYTPSGGWARVELHSFANHVEIRVADSGIGIPPDDLGELFTNFFRTQEASDRAIQGVGLGLSISRTIVEKHGGRLEVVSRPGQGSVFSVVLPADDTELRAMRAAS